MASMRRATQSDCEDLCAIQVSAILGSGGSHYTEADLDAWSGTLRPERYLEEIAQRLVIVAEEGARVVGFGTLDANTGEVRAVYVRPRHAGRGIGSAILSRLIEEAAQLGLDELFCQSSLNAVAFYEKAGFQRRETRKHRFPDGAEIDCGIMTRSLA